MKFLHTIVLLASLSAAAVVAAEPVSIRLLQSDRYASRGVVVTRTDGASIRGVLSIAAYDRATRSFVLETAAQGPTTVPAAGLRGFAFSRALLRSSPQAQTCPSETFETAGPSTVIEIAAADLSIDRDVLQADVPRTSAPLADGSQLELQSLDYDAAKGLFRAAVQTVAYRVEFAKCGGSSPMGGKALQ